MNPNLGGVTLGWNLNHTAQDHLFAAIEGTAFHTRVILERMAEHGVPINRVIHGGGIPQKNEVLNQVYANVLGKPVLVPERSITSLGSAIFAFLAAGTFATIEEAQQALCPPYRTVQPDRSVKARYDRLFAHWRKLYFSLGVPGFGSGRGRRQSCRIFAPSPPRRGDRSPRRALGRVVLLSELLDVYALAVGAEPVRERDVGMVADVPLHLRPQSLIAPDLLAPGADRQEPAQLAHLGETALQLLGAASGSRRGSR